MPSIFTAAPAFSPLPPLSCDASWWTTPAPPPNAQARVDFNGFLVADSPRLGQMLILNEALRRLSEMNARQACLVEMIYFGGLSQKETPAVLGIESQ